MHIFFYDPVLANSKYSSLLAQIETKITDLGLGGKIIRLSQLYNFEKSISDEAKPGQTLVFIGPDTLLNQSLPILAKKDLIIGFIPLQNKQILAGALGINGPFEACDIIAARRIIKLDLVLANEKAFLTELKIKSQHCSIDIGNNISLDIQSENEVTLTNLSLDNNITKSCPDDQLLELVIKTKSKATIFKKATEGFSYFQNSNFFINADNTEGILDFTNTITLPIKIEIIPKALNFIVGRSRNF